MLKYGGRKSLVAVQMYRRGSPDLESIFLFRISALDVVLQLRRVLRLQARSRHFLLVSWRYPSTIALYSCEGLKWLLVSTVRQG